MPSRLTGLNVYDSAGIVTAVDDLRISAYRNRGARSS